MKKFGLLLLAVVMVAGCGGGDDDGVPGECITYCQDACNKFVTCDYFPISQAPACADTCVDSLKEEDADDPEACVAANNFFDTLSCSELRDLMFGSAVDTGANLGRSCRK